jgi:hypothetical protein
MRNEFESMVEAGKVFKTKSGREKPHETATGKREE